MLQLGDRSRGPALALLLLFAASGPIPVRAQAPAPSDQDPLRASATITGLIAKQELAGAAEAAGEVMGGETSRDKVLGILKALDAFGSSQYTDRVYSRAFGKSSFDIIDKINFNSAILFVRYTFHVENDRWILLNFKYKTENELPLPAEWRHIYP